MNHPLALVGRTAVHHRLLLRRAAPRDPEGRTTLRSIFVRSGGLCFRPTVPPRERCCFATSSSTRSLTAASSIGSGSPVVPSTTNNEAVRKHRELQSLLHGEESSSATATTATITTVNPNHQRNPMIHQRLRQAFINAALAFFVVILAMQGVKNGHELRKAQQLQKQAEDELENARRLLRSLVTEEEEEKGDGALRIAARDALRAAASSSSSAVPSSDAYGWWWRRIVGLSRQWIAPPPDLEIDDPDHDAVDRAVKVLRDHLSSRIGVVVQTSAEREVEALRHLSATAASAVAAAAAATTATTAEDDDGSRSTAAIGVAVAAAAKEKGGADPMPSSPTKERVFVL